MPEKAAADCLEGTVEQVVYYNPENGYTVCRFSTEDGRDLTVVGSFPPLSAGEVLRVTGKWEVNPRFGQQFRVENFVPILPSSVKGIEKFLSSGLVKGIGPVLARRIVKKFGGQTIDVISKKPDKILEVEGVGSVKLREIKKSWQENQHIRDLIIFLQEHGVSTTIATKVHRQYGDRSFQVLKTNPYQLCLDIWGIGFKTADQIALKLGMDPSSPERVKAFILYLLEKAAEQGHVFSFEEELEDACAKELGVEAQKTREAAASLLQDRLVRIEEHGERTAVYLPYLFEAQEGVAKAILRIGGLPPPSPPPDIERTIAAVEKDLSLKFSPRQKEAIRECFHKRLLIITGGPGTGKTTIIRAVVAIFDGLGQKVLLTAPTGRAAKRLSEATRKEAKTIHRTLEYSPKQGAFRKNERHPLRADAIVVDEFSMVDLPLMFALVKAVPAWMRMILVGDKDQLPPVGPGNLLHDIIESGRVAVVRLDEIFRQERDSLIVLNAHRINQGLSLVYPPREDRDADFYFVHHEDEEKAFKSIMSMCCFNIPRKLGLPALTPQIQVISPMYRGLCGVDNLNVELQARLNPHSDGLKIGNREFRVRDKVMQIRNDYEKEIYNGDIGTIVHLDKQRFRLLVDFDGREVGFEKEELSDITHAYAVSVHKSQGSEYQAVVMPLLTQHYIMLQRNLFYTALTRAKKLSVIVGSYRALHIAIKNYKPIERNGLLKEKLMAAPPFLLV
ncbi:MAG: ATP-dependent RecD-like DNA helicase [Clostridiales bacterium]|nr:ATP-dependent RecD-like DNA helicase [Clostridiales bacterium]